MTSTRILSAVIFFAILLAGLFVPSMGWVVVAIALGAGALGTIEFCNLGRVRPPVAFTVIATAAALALIFDGYRTGLQYAAAIVGGLTVAVALAGVWIDRDEVASLAGRAIAGPLYAALPLALIMWIWGASKFGDGDLSHRAALLILFLIFVTWSGDVGAYFTGRAIGKRKLAPKLSPGKTIEGSAGGMALTLAVALGLKAFWPAMGALFQWVDAIAIALVISILGPLGDLAESRFKRAAGVKDSGNTLTGHGGMLDIIDSLLVTAVFYYVYLTFFYRG